MYLCVAARLVQGILTAEQAEEGLWVMHSHVGSFIVGYHELGTSRVLLLVGCVSIFLSLCVISSFVYREYSQPPMFT